MGNKQLTDEQITTLISKNTNLSFWTLGERVFFQPPPNTNANAPYYIGKIMNTDKAESGVVTIKSLEQCEFFPLDSKY